MGGATSADVHSGLGMPISGMSSQERHHDGQIHRKKDRSGTDQYGETGDMQRARKEAEADKE